MKLALQSLFLLLAIGANAQTTVLVFIDGTATPLARAVSAEKECSGITIDTLMGGRRSTDQWSMAQRVGNGRGQYEIWLEHTSASRYTFLGHDVNKAARKACRIILGKEPWAGLPVQ